MILRFIKSPSGRAVRRLVAAQALVTGLSRLNILGGLALPSMFAPRWVFGVAMLLCFVALTATTFNGWRIKPVGRISAIIAAGWFLALAWDARTSPASSLISFLSFYAMIGEAGTLRDDL